MSVLLNTGLITITIKEIKLICNTLNKKLIQHKYNNNLLDLVLSQLKNLKQHHYYCSFLPLNDYYELEEAKYTQK